MDRRIEALKDTRYFRYADDILVLASTRDAALECAVIIDDSFTSLKLQSKASQKCDLVLQGSVPDDVFSAANQFRHLGLLFRNSGGIALSRDKSRKIQNLFRFAFRRSRRRWLKERDPRQRTAVLCSIAAATIGRGVRNVAILDYYLRHVDDEQQLRLLDRWLAEEVLSQVFGGHKKGNFGKISFEELRSMGLPSLRHRRRLLRNGKIPSTFFLWRKEKSARAFRETVGQASASCGRLLSVPGSSSHQESVGEDGCL